MPHVKEAFEKMVELIPEIKKLGPFKSLLLVGWRHDTNPWWYDEFCKSLEISKVSVLEIHPPNHADLEAKVWEGRYNLTPILGDVRVADKFVKELEYDLIWMDHGPEHLSSEELNSVTSLLQKLANKMVLYCCPWGVWVNGVEENNEFEEHKTSVYPKMLEQHGMKVFTINKEDQTGSGELIAYCDVSSEAKNLLKSGY